MDSLPNAFRAHAAPALNEKPKRSAYVFGAASPLGEVMLNHVLANPKYTQVFVMTTAPLPATIAHLQGINDAVFAFQNDDTVVDCFFTVHAQDPLSKAAHMPQFGVRQHVYKPLEPTELGQTLAQVDVAASQASAVQMQWCVLGREASVHQLASSVASYAAKTACIVYGLPEGARPQREATVFAPQGTHFLDRVGAGLLNTVARFMAQMANPAGGAPLTNVKTAQRLMQRFDSLAADSKGTQLLTQQDLV
jgi:hypothetical protein